MVDLVDLKTVKKILRIDHDDDDQALEQLIRSASERIILYFKSRAKEVLALDDNGKLTEPIPAPIVISAAIYVGILYRNVDQDPDNDWDPSKLPAMVTANLYPFRDPTLA